MRTMKSVYVMLTLAFVVGTLATADNVDAEEPAAMGPPSWVIEAWESGEAPLVPTNGPPAWVIEAWQNGERPQRPTGPPPWVAERHQRAVELGLPGPPPEVIKAWESGEGFDLPGPPDFVLELLGLLEF